jgi:hypothetical protein
MYGLVNHSFEHFVRQRYGDQVWQQVRTAARLDNEQFMLMGRYDDAVTYDLVGATVATTGANAADLLEEFGQYWVTYSERGAYSGVMRMFGRTLPELLGNLDLMHAQISRTMPDLSAPSFHCSAQTPTSLVLHYKSSRPGLAPFVAGLIKGLGASYDTPVRVSQVAEKGDTSDDDRFLVEFSGR